MVTLRRTPAVKATASGTHDFVTPPDGRSGLALGASQAGAQMTTPMAVASASLDDARCALTGCGKPRRDPIHWPVDESEGR